MLSQSFSTVTQMPPATFYVEDEGYPIEEGMLITFPGGSVPHHIEMKKEDGGFVHMLGPVEIGGSHGTVGAFIALDAGKQSAKAKINSRRMLQVDGSEQDSTTTTSTNNIAGEITVTGYRDGIDSIMVPPTTLSRLIIDWKDSVL